MSTTAAATTIPAGTLVTVHTTNGGRVTGTTTHPVRVPAPTFGWDPIEVATQPSWGDLSRDAAIRVVLPIAGVSIGGQAVI